MTSGYIITGTDTGIGKTVFAAGITAALNATYWKPIQSGLEDETDTDTVQRLANLPSSRSLTERYRLTTPCSPHRAAELDGIEIDVTELSLPTPQAGSPLIVEGAGGLLVPITRSCLQIDIFKRFGLPIIVCAHTSLGTINHTLLSLEALNARKMPVVGVAFIGEENADSERTICEMGGAMHLGRLPHLSPLNEQTLRTAMVENFQSLLSKRIHA